MASDYLLVIDGIKGESEDKQYKESIELQHFSWHVANGGTFQHGGGGGAGKASFADLSCQARASKASPNLMQKCAGGDHISKAVLHVRKQGGGQKEYYTVTLEDLLVSSYSCTPDEHGGADSFSLNYAKIKFEYKPQDSKGALGAAVTGTWDIKKNVQ